MNLDEALKHYGGSITKMASALGVSRQTIYLWKECDPFLQAGSDRTRN